MADVKLTLAAKIAKIASEIGPIAKGGTNAQQHYKFIEYAEVAAQVRKLQAENGVAIIPEIESYTCDRIQNSKGGAGFHYLLNMVFKVVNTDDKEDYFEVKWIGEAADYGDKGINKAVTSAAKFFFMRLYNISEKGDKEADAETPEMADIDTPRVERIYKVNFNDVRETLPEIDTVNDLEDYWHSLGKLSDGQAKILQSMFAKRKAEINGVER